MIGTLILISALIPGAFAFSDTEFEDTEIGDKQLSKWDCPTCSGNTQDIWQAAAWAGIMSYYDEGEDEGLTGAKEARAEMEAQEERSFEGFVHKEYLASVDDVADSDLILDVGRGYANSHIKGAVPLYWEELLDEENKPRSASEMAQILGGAGISNEDSVIIYGDCTDCGGKSVATFVFWAMRYLGHDNVKLLDGGIEEWETAEKPVETKTNSRPATTYTPRPRPALISDYEEITSGEVQLVDARTFQEFATEKIPGAIHIEYERMLDNGRIKNANNLDDVFSSLEKDIPVAVYSNAGAKASMIWYALQILGYDSSIYTWNDWLAHQSLDTKKVVLTGARAEPNPARPGPVTIYANFQVVEGETSTTEGGLFESPAEEISIEKPAAEDSPVEDSTEDNIGEDIVGDESTTDELADGEITDEADEEPAVEENSAEAVGSPVEEAEPKDEPVLNVMGCVACFPVDVYASSSTSASTPAGGVRLGSIGGTPITEAGALVQNEDGEEMARIELTHTGGDEFTGTWDASDKPEGLYTVILAASAGSDPFYFENALTIEISNSAPAQENTNVNNFVKLGRFS